MNSMIAQAIALKTNPVALIWADEKPSDAIEKMLGDNLMSFAAPYAMFREMEGNVKGSFLERGVWKSLQADR